MCDGRFKELSTKLDDVIGLLRGPMSAPSTGLVGRQDRTEKRLDDIEKAAKDQADALRWWLRTVVGAATTALVLAAMALLGVQR